MRNLFVKIFLWFWLASILIIASTIVLMSLLEPYEPDRRDERHIRRLALFGRMAVEVIEKRGASPLNGRFPHGRHRPGGNTFLFSENSRLLIGENPSPEVRELAERSLKSGVAEFKRLENSILIAQSVYGSGGRYYIVVGEIPKRHQHSPFLEFLSPRFLSLRLLAIFIVASIFCYWLAWYLTSPVRKLQTAARGFAAGDFSTRVAPELEGRRDELAALAQDFDIMAERVDSLIIARQRLLRDISHELRSPLARLNVALELARQRAGREAGEALDRIELESDRLNRLISQLRTLTLLESGADNPDKRTFDLSSLIKEISDDAAFEAGNSNRFIKTDISQHITVKGSEELIYRAIENVVRNAIRYTAEGTQIEISLKPQMKDGKNFAELTVRDHGPGVPKEALANLFTPFYRVAESRDRRSGGMGIGLSITERAVRLHGGNVKALNTPGGGLIIQIELPAVTV